MNNVKIKTIVTRHQKQVFFMAGRPQRASSAGAQAGGAGAQAGDPQRASSAGAQARGRQQKASSAGAQAGGEPVVRFIKAFYHTPDKVQCGP